MDVEREIDVVEEVARVYGFNNFANTVPAFSGSVVEQAEAVKESKLRARGLALGYDEAISPTFISAADAQKFSARAPVPLENPLSDQAPLLRNSLVPGMLNMLAWNFNRGASDLRLFEIGNVFASVTSGVEERRQMCLAATGSADPRGLEVQARFLDVFDVKGSLETLLEIFSNKPDFDAAAADYYHPGRSAKITLAGHTVGQCGQLHPEVAAERKLKQEVWIAELDLDRLLSIPLREPRYEPLARYPSVDRDFSFVLDDSTVYAVLRSAIEALRIPELRSLEALELFRGGSLPSGKYALLIRLRFQSSERTLRDEEVAGWSQQVIRAVEALGGSLRG
jgi:phenylalanyl-tRNA synthetase beta chain